MGGIDIVVIFRAFLFGSRRFLGLEARAGIDTTQVSLLER